MKNISFLFIVVINYSLVINFSMMGMGLPQELMETIRVFANIPNYLSISHQSSECSSNKWDISNYNIEYLIPSSYGRSQLPIQRLDKFYKRKDVLLQFSKPFTCEVGFESPRSPLYPKSPTNFYSSSWSGSNAGYIGDNTLADNNNLDQGCVALAYDDENKHTLIFLKTYYDQRNSKDNYDYKVRFCKNDKKDSYIFGNYKGMICKKPGIVIGLTMYPDAEQVVYLTQHKINSSILDTIMGNSLQRMQVAVRNFNGVEIVVSAPTPDNFKKIVPFHIQDVYSHFALSNQGHLWKVYGKDGAIQYSRIKVCDKEGIEKTYCHLAIENELIAVCDKEGNVFLGDPNLKPQPMLMYLSRLSNPGNIKTFSFVNNVIYAVYEKSFFGNNYPLQKIEYNPQAWTWCYIQKILNRR